MAGRQGARARRAAAAQSVRRATGLSDYLLDELEQNQVNLREVAALLEYGRLAARLDTPAARRRELSEARIVVTQLRRTLGRAQRWYREHVAGADADPRRPVYWAVGELRARLADASGDDPMLVAAGRPIPSAGRVGRPDRPWLREIRAGLAAAGCSRQQITDVLVEAGFHAGPKPNPRPK
jgi:hypothetical protein